MSGICGFIRISGGKPPDEHLLSVMAASLNNGGSERDKIFIDRETGIGVTAKTGTEVISEQNFFSLDNEIFVIGLGEIYGSSNGMFCESVGRLYRKEKEGFINKIDGQFNLCIWDKKEEKLIVATDCFGTSALHYYYDGKCFIFSSKIRAILKSGAINPGIDKNAIYEYLNFLFVPTPRTVYSQINKLPPGEMLTLDKNGLKLKKYWDISYSEGGNKKEEFYRKEIFSGVEKAVKKYVDAHNDSESLGAFLSGGLDSSTICGMLAKLTGCPAKAFSIGFKEEAYSELGYARIAAKHFGLKHYEHIVSPQEAIDAIKILIREYDEPYGNTSAVAAYYCMKLAAQNGVKFIFGGDGGDENFAGYSKYVTNKIFLLYQHLPSFSRKRLIEPLVFNAPFPNNRLLQRLKNYIKHSNIPDPQRIFDYDFYPLNNRKDIFSDDFINQINADSPIKVLRGLFDSVETEKLLNKLLYIDSKLGLIDNDLRGKIDKISQILGVKAFFPFLDKSLWESSGKIPVHLKIKGYDKKYIFKKAFGGFLPEEIIKKRKHGFGLPFALWLRNDATMRTFVQNILLDTKTYSRGYFKSGVFEKLINANDAEVSPYYGNILSVFLMLELWHREWADR